MNKITSMVRDWLILIGYATLIYSTLPLMPKASAFFSSLLGRYFGLFSNILLTIVILAIFTFIFKRKVPTKNPLLFYSAMTAIFISYFVLLLFALPIVAEKMHLLEYGFLSYLALRAVKSVQPPWKRYVCVVFIIVLVGYCDELIQKFIPNRFYETKDVILNVVSGILGLFVLKLLKCQSA